MPEAAFLAAHTDVAAPGADATPEQRADYLHQRLAHELAERRRLAAARDGLAAAKRRRTAALDTGTALLAALGATAAQVRAQLPALARALALPPAAPAPPPPSRGPEALARVHAALRRACGALAQGSGDASATVAPAPPAAVRGYASLLPRVSEDMFVANAAVVLRLAADAAVEFRCVRSTKGLCFVTAQVLGTHAHPGTLDNLFGDGGKGDSEVLTRFAESAALNALCHNNSSAGSNKTVRASAVAAMSLATAYQWAQQLGEKEGEDGEERLTHAVRCVQALHARLTAQCTLEAQLAALTRGDAPDAAVAGDGAPLRVVPTVRLAKWTEGSAGDDEVLALAEPAPALAHRVFRAEFVRGAVSVAGTVTVDAANPAVPPRISLERPTQCTLAPFYAAMERSVVATANTLGLTPTTAPARGPRILSAQIRYLLVCFCFSLAILLLLFTLLLFF